MTNFHELSDINGFQQWLFRTKMSFFEVELDLPLWFGMSSWHYAIYGIVMLLVEPKWARHSFFPYRTYALWMIFLQSPLSFAADYVHMTDDSIYHVLDRMLATPAALVEIVRLFAAFCNGVYFPIIVARMVIGAAAVFCFTQSAIAQADLNRDAFISWHYLWHMYPILASLLVWIDYKFCREPPASSTYHFRRLDAAGSKKLVE